MLIALSRKSHGCGTPDTVPAFHRPGTSIHQLNSPLEKLTGGHFIFFHINHPLTPMMPRLPPSEAAHVEPGLLGMNMTMLFPSLPWETATLLQLGVQPGLNLPSPSSPHIGPAKALLTLGLYNWARHHKHNLPSRAARIIKPGQMCLLEQKLVLQNSVQDLMEKEVMFLYKHLPESQFYLFTAIP